MPTSRLLIFTTCLIASIASTAHADWPKRVFIPYVYLGNGDNFKLTDCDDQIGQKYYTLAFIIADRKTHAPTWFGEIPMARNLYADQITAIRQRGGDVVCSFGGEAGTELAISQTDPVALEAAYQSVVDQYKFTWLDFDIEGDNLDQHPDANHRRNAALAALQKKYPDLVISYTLPVDPDGISEASQKLLADAKSQGVVVHSANIMVMYFGHDFLATKKSEAELGIASALKAHSQIQAIDPRIQIGLCPCIGTNGSKKEIFTLADANTLRAFADKTDWVCSLSFWSMNRDSQKKHGGDTSSGTPQRPWDFASAFKSFTTGSR
jgi:chitinase